MGDEVAHNDAHGAVAEEFSGGIVVCRGDSEFVACGDWVAACFEERDYGDSEEMALRVGFRWQHSDGFRGFQVFSFCDSIPRGFHVRHLGIGDRSLRSFSFVNFSLLDLRLLNFCLYGFSVRYVTVGCRF